MRWWVGSSVGGCLHAGATQQRMRGAARGSSKSKHQYGPRSTHQVDVLGEQGDVGLLQVLDDAVHEVQRGQAGPGVALQQLE